jgi:hypothetical protein
MVVSENPPRYAIPRITPRLTLSRRPASSVNTLSAQRLWSIDFDFEGTRGVIALEDNWIFYTLACVSCTRLRPIAKFSIKMSTKKKAPGGAQAYKRFYIECGRRSLLGLHRYILGAARWQENSVPYTRCKQCKTIAKGPED